MSDASPLPRGGGSYSDGQIVEAVRRKLVSFEDFLEEIQKGEILDEKHDVKFLMHLDRLIRELFVRGKEGRTIGKMRACRLIPAQHIDTCKKYIHEAEQRQIIAIEADPTDGRQSNVRLTQQFIAFIERRAVSKLETALAIARQS